MAVITSITNIQNLQNLETFSVSSMGFSTLNLSNLPNLQTVDAGNQRDNEDNFSLTSIDISNSTSIIDLAVDGSILENQLDSIIGFSALTGLKYLRIDDSTLSGSIDLSIFPLLEYVQVGVNLELTELILTGSQSLLTEIRIGTCAFSGSLDFSAFPALQYLDVKNNEQLSEVIISDIQPIQELAANGCALTQTAVDNILVALSTNGVTDGICNLSEGTNSPPGEDGLNAIVVLEGNNWAVTVNTE